MHWLASPDDERERRDYSRIRKLALWEPPFIPDDSRARPPADTARTYSELVVAGRRGDAVEFFMARVVGLPPEFVAQARSPPWWPAQGRYGTRMNDRPKYKDGDLLKRLRLVDSQTTNSGVAILTYQPRRES